MIDLSLSAMVRHLHGAVCDWGLDEEHVEHVCEEMTAERKTSESDGDVRVEEQWTLDRAKPC